MYLEGKVWSLHGLRHGVLHNVFEEESVTWVTLCGLYEVIVTTSRTNKPPHLFNGFVTCLQCLAKEFEP